MDEGLAQRFEQNRTRLRAVAYRMIGSLSGADDPSRRRSWPTRWGSRWAAGPVMVPHDRPYAIIGFTVRDGRIVQIDILADPARLRQFDLATLRA